MFTETAFNRKKRRNELVAKCFFGFMASAMVIPLFLIIGYIVVQGAPAISWEFLTENPRSGGAKGGIWAALVGTIYIVFFSLVISAPIGVLAAVYLNEYATENWFTRVVNLAVVNLAGVPSIVHGLFGVGAFVYFANFNNGKKSIIAAALTLAVMTLPVIIASTKEALASVPRQFRLFAEQGRNDLEALALCMTRRRHSFTAEELSGLDVPVLIVIGETDTVTGPPGALAEALPSARVVIVPKRDHMSTVGDKITKAEVLAFLRGG